MEFPNPKFQTKVHGSLMARFLKQTPKIDWFGEDQRSKHRNDTCLKTIGLHLLMLIIPHSTMNTIGRTYASSSEITQTCIPDNHN